MELGEGMRLLYNDKSCSEIAQHITDGGVADIYVEEVVEVEEEKATHWALDEVEDEAEEMDIDVPASILTNVVTTLEKQRVKDLDSFRQFYKSPSPKPMAADKGKTDGSSSESSDDDDDDYQPKDENSSGDDDDDEAEQVRKFAKQVKMETKGKDLVGSE